MNTAKWLGRRIDYRHYEYKCSKCGYSLRYKKPFYCPGCGSQMVEEQTEKSAKFSKVMKGVRHD